MNTPRLLLAVLSSAFASLLLAPSAFAQGALTPPGAPAPTMKTLDQIEARKPLGTPNVVTTSTIVIDQPGSYVLVGPITVASGDGITINASNVTLDLNGFTISSTAASGDSSGVRINGDGNSVSNVSVSNGFIYGAYAVAANGTGSGTGFSKGVFCDTALPYNLRANRVSIRGVRGVGIYFSEGSNGNAPSTISECHSAHTGSTGLRSAIVENCSVSDISSGLSYGISAYTVKNCVSLTNHNEYGISAASVSDSVALAKEFGISATTVTNSVASGRIGITAFLAVTNSAGDSTAEVGTGIGIHSPNGIVSYSRGNAPIGGANRSIIARIAVACAAPDGAAPIQSPSLQLGTVGVAP